jgi:hypothetical protein
MRRGMGLQPPATDAVSLAIGNYYTAPLNARKIDKNVYPTAANRYNILESDPIYLYHPAPRQDLQSPLALTPLSPAHSTVLLENHYLTGVHSAKDPNVSTYKIFFYLPHEVNFTDTVTTVIYNQLTHMQTAGLPTSPAGLEALQVTENSAYPVIPEIDDEPITSTTEVMHSLLRTCPYSFNLTLPTFCLAAYGLHLLASRQARWATTIPDTLIPPAIPQPIRKTLLQQMPTVIRGDTEPPKPSRDICYITSSAFTGQRPTVCHKHFKAAILYTTYKLITAAEYRYQHERATSAAELSPPLQALLQVIDAVQPATRWVADERANTIAFTPMEVDYNPVRLQSMPCALYLTHPETPTTNTRYLIRPPSPPF